MILDVLRCTTDVDKSNVSFLSKRVVNDVIDQGYS